MHDVENAEFVRRVHEPRAASAEPGRHAARRSAMMVLYRADVMRGSGDDELFGDEPVVAADGSDLPTYARELIDGVRERGSDVDAAITAHLTDWTLDRLGAVERAILRIAAFELLRGEVPGAIVIDEAVELTKRYASPEAAKLVNGVLGSLVNPAESSESTS